MKKIIFVLLILSMQIFAAELPEKGIDPPLNVFGPSDHPVNPPIGNGLFIVLGFAVFYAIKKRKDRLS